MSKSAVMQRSPSEAIVIGEKVGALQAAKKTHLWVDVDAGVDDAFAMGVVLSRMNLERSLEVVGMSCVSGNVYAPQVAKNIATIFSIFDVDPGRPPVTMGALRPLVEPPREPTGVSLPAAGRL